MSMWIRDGEGVAAVTPITDFLAMLAAQIVAIGLLHCGISNVASAVAACTSYATIYVGGRFMVLCRNSK